MDIKKEYERWLANATMDADVAAELKMLNDTKIEDAFYRDLAFGTGGLRGVIGAGTNRMNVYTVAKASQGLADYLKKNFAEPSVAIGYDSRIKSDVFAKVAAGVFAANGVKVNIWPVLMPVPTVSFATRYLHTSAGVMVTASHNPSKYNGYKVYGADGCQITTEAAAEILAEIEKLDIFADVKNSDFEAGIANGSIQYIPDEVYTVFVEQVKSQSVLFGEEVNKDVAIVYSPLNGTGLKPVTRTLKEMGYTNITVVKEQEQPDGNFPTCPFPNPEIKQAFECALKLAESVKPDLLLATDPDCDRVGIAVNNGKGDFQLMTGNEVGAMLLNYLLSQKKAQGTLSESSIAVKSFVSTDLAEVIAKKYNCTFKNLLTGFKYIGELITELEKQGKASDFVMGFEESYGYLAGTHARDKDAVVASMLICEMAAYYKSQGKTLIDVMNGLYDEFGYYCNTVQSYTFEGAAGMEKMAAIMDGLRDNKPSSFAGYEVTKIDDYKTSKSTIVKTGEESEITLPKSNVLAYTLTNGNKVIVRPSGTEPKIKAYITAIGQSEENAKEIAQRLLNDANELMK